MKTETRSASTYNTFIEQVESSQVQRVTIKPNVLQAGTASYRIEYTLKTEFGTQHYYTNFSGNIEIEKLTDLLESHNVEFINLPNNSDATAGILGLLLSTGVLMGLFAWLLKFSNSGGSIGVGMGLVKQNIDKAHDIALEILLLNRGLLESTTQLLLEKEVLEGEQLQGILAQVEAPDGLNVWLAKG